MSFGEPLESTLFYLPKEIVTAIRRLSFTYPDFEFRVTEIRLRAERVSSLTVGEKNLPIFPILTRQDIAETVEKIGQNALYANAETRKEGYITLPNGCRVGLAGRAIAENGKIGGICDVTGLSVRLARSVSGAGTEAEIFFNSLPTGTSMLVFGAPGSGKTTCLRDLAVRLSSGVRARRVAVVDSRGEFAETPDMRGAMLDILTGYPKARGIEIAVRTLTPEIAVADEIGAEEDAEACAAVAGCGVPMILSAHAGSVAELLSRPPIRTLLRVLRVGGYFGLSRVGDRIVGTGIREYEREAMDVV